MVVCKRSVLSACLLNDGHLPVSTLSFARNFVASRLALDKESPAPQTSQNVRCFPFVNPTLNTSLYCSGVRGSALHYPTKQYARTATTLLLAHYSGTLLSTEAHGGVAVRQRASPCVTVRQRHQTQLVSSDSRTRSVSLAMNIRINLIEMCRVIVPKLPALYKVSFNRPSLI